MTTTTLTQTRSTPTAVRAAFAVWLGALACGVAEMLLHLGDAPLGAIGVRLAIYAALALVMVRMRAGRNWARWTLALLLGIVGTLSLVIEPISWLADGNSIGAAFDGATLTWVLIAVSRAAHLLCVLVAVPLMFVPSANAFFRR